MLKKHFSDLEVIILPFSMFIIRGRNMITATNGALKILYSCDRSEGREISESN